MCNTQQDGAPLNQVHINETADMRENSPPGESYLKPEVSTAISHFRSPGVSRACEVYAGCVRLAPIHRMNYIRRFNIKVLLTRCRIGHSRLTHSFLLNNQSVPECMFCACPLTIRHVLLLDCADLILLWQQYFNAVSMSDLFLNVDGQTILAFLKASYKAWLLWLLHIFWFFIYCDHDLSLF